MFSLPMMNLRLTGISKQQKKHVQAMFPAFTSEGSEHTADVYLECSAHRLATPLNPNVTDLTQDGFYVPRKTWLRDRVELMGLDFFAEADFSGAKPELSLATYEERQLASRDVIENTLKVLSAHVAVRQGGLVLHSAGLVFDERAYLFCGRSNVGKTTLSEKAHKMGARVLSDDINLVMPQNDGFRAYSVPFTGEFGRMLPPEDGLVSYPVAAVSLLVQGSSLSLESVSPASAAAAVLTCCPFVNTDERESEALFDAAISFVTRLPVLRLTNTKEDAACDIMAAINWKMAPGAIA